MSPADVKIKRSDQFFPRSLWTSCTSTKYFNHLMCNVCFLHLYSLHRCKPVMTEPLFKMWREADMETMSSRLGAIIKIWAKKHVI